LLTDDLLATATPVFDFFIRVETAGFHERARGLLTILISLFVLVPAHGR
jgi:hypothetical protein